MTMRVGIIGGGIAGLTLAALLRRAGHSPLVLDKGRGPGGRASTRRGDGVAFDHGAQYYTARDPSFRAFLDDHVPADRRARWDGRFAALDGDQLAPETLTSPRYVGVPGMGAIARSIAGGVEIRAETRVVRVEGSPGRWSLVDASGREDGPFDWVVASAPPAQSSALLKGLSPIADEAARVAMRPCFALMVAPADGATLPFDGIRCRHPVLGWAANDHGKPGRGPKPALVIQSSHDWASSHVDDDLGGVAEALRAATLGAFGVDVGPVGPASVHRWLYARPDVPLGRPALVDVPGRLALCGDWCVAAKVEGAYQSGQACAEAILSA